MEVDPDVRELRRKQTEMVQAMQSKKKGFKLDDVANLVLSMHSDLNATHDELQRYISMSDKQLSERLQDGVTKLSVFQQNLEANDRSIVDMHQKLTANDERLHQLAIQTAKDIEESLNNRMQALQDKMDQEMQHKANQLQELFETMDLTRRQLIAKEALLRNESRVLMHKNNELITGSLKASEKETREYLLSELHSTADRLSNVQATCEENTCDRMDKADRFANDLHRDLTLLMEKVAANIGLWRIWLATHPMSSQTEKTNCAMTTGSSLVTWRPEPTASPMLSRRWKISQPGALIGTSRTPPFSWPNWLRRVTWSRHLLLGYLQSLRQQVLMTFRWSCGS